MDDYDIQARIMPVIITDQPSIDRVIDSIISAYGNTIPPETAESIRRLDYKSTLDICKLWLEHLLEKVPPESNIRAIYFGMFDSCPDEHAPVEHTQLYVDGSADFDIDGDWAGACSWTYGSDFRYPVLPAFIELAKHLNGLTSLCTFTFSQALAACIAIELAPLIGDALGFEEHDRYPVALGHDAGDLFLIGYASPDGVTRP